MPARTGIELSFNLSSRCVRCKAERKAEGKRILSSKGDSGTTFVIESPTPCEHCGERRIKVSFAIGEG